MERKSLRGWSLLVLLVGDFAHLEPDLPFHYCY